MFGHVCDALTVQALCV
uniref:Uncharacterized protein n=1 Tax=Anguilla anguilla TaxID=7936 RepID=A0A0E9SM78_ANGAN